MRNSFLGMSPVGFAVCSETKRVTMASMKAGRAPSREELRKARVLDRAALENKVLNIRISKLEQEMQNAGNKN